jgi:hypothetical protein
MIKNEYAILSLMPIYTSIGFLCFFGRNVGGEKRKRKTKQKKKKKHTHTHTQRERERDTHTQIYIYGLLLAAL